MNTLCLFMRTSSKMIQQVGLVASRSKVYIFFLAAALGYLACLAAALGYLACLAAALGSLACIAAALGSLAYNLT